MEGHIGQILSNPVLGAYFFNTIGSTLDVVSTAYLHSRTGNPDEQNEAIKNVMDERGPIMGGIITERNRRIGFGLLSLGLLAVDKIVTPTLFGADFHLTELGLYGMGIIYFGASFLNFSSTLGIPTTKKIRERNR